MRPRPSGNLLNSPSLVSAKAGRMGLICSETTPTRRHAPTHQRTPPSPEARTQRNDMLLLLVRLTLLLLVRPAPLNRLGSPPRAFNPQAPCPSLHLSRSPRPSSSNLRQVVLAAFELFHACAPFMGITQCSIQTLEDVH